MSITSGSYSFGPESGRLLVHTTRTGLGAKAGHDLTIEVTRWQGEAVIDTADPARSSVRVTAEAASLEVRRGTGGVKPLTAADRGEIERIIRERILGTARHPAITFRSAAVAGTADEFRLEGPLTIAGVTRHATVRGSLTDGRARGSAVITQSRWGIRPYSAFFGALRLSDDVEVTFDVGLVPR